MGHSGTDSGTESGTNSGTASGLAPRAGDYNARTRAISWPSTSSV
jgi:hypothetical protein